MITVVLDTNVLISGSCLPNSIPGKLLHLWLNHAFNVALSENILQEFEDVMSRPKIRTPYSIGVEVVHELLEVFREQAHVLDVHEISAAYKEAVSDPADAHILACALEAQASYIVTGDRHLLALNQYGAVQIVTPVRFYAELQLAGTD